LWSQAGINLSAIRELKTLQELNHPNVIRIRDVFAHNSNINLVLDFMCAELEQIIKDKRNIDLTVGHIKSFMLQILEGIAHIHQNWILHRDLKPGNILIDDKKCLKISDFGLARNFGSPTRNMSHQAITRVLTEDFPFICLNSPCGSGIAHPSCCLVPRTMEVQWICGLWAAFLLK
jgi:cyclin-dependent kinase 7